MNIANNLANFSFLTLFASLIFFWIGTSFNNFLNIKIIAKYFVLISNVLLSFWLILRWKESGHFPLSNLYESLMFLSWCFTLSNLLLEKPSSFMVRNSKASESLAALALDGFVPQEQGKQNQLGSNPLYNSINKRNKRNVEILSFDSFSIVGAVSIPSALLTNAFATFTLPKEMQEASSLVPALQSNWLMMHVTVMILSYATLILGSLLSIAFLIVTFSQNSHNFFKARDKEGLTSLPPTEAQELALGIPRERVAPKERVLLKATRVSSPKAKKVTQAPSLVCLAPSLSAHRHKALVSSPSAKTQALLSATQEFAFGEGQVLLSFLDNLSYRFLGFGFPLLTIGILSGAVWANEAWGSYWSWDPKETWAFLTWLVFAIYLHLRLSYGLEGEKPAYVASFGFVIVWICFLGVNFLGEGLHSYGWIVKS